MQRFLIKIYDEIYIHKHLIALKMKAIWSGCVSVAAINYWVFPWIALIDVKLASTPSALSPLSSDYVAEIKNESQFIWAISHSKKHTQIWREKND